MRCIAFATTRPAERMTQADLAVASLVDERVPAFIFGWPPGRAAVFCLLSSVFYLLSSGRGRGRETPYAKPMSTSLPGMNLRQVSLDSRYGKNVRK
jgi:hypothetical protein